MENTNVTKTEDNQDKSSPFLRRNLATPESLSDSQVSQSSSSSIQLSRSGDEKINEPGTTTETITRSKTVSLLPKEGILRTDSSSLRSSSSNRYGIILPKLTIPQVEDAEPSSPQPSVDRLSVTFAIATERTTTSIESQHQIVKNFDFNHHQRRRATLLVNDPAPPPATNKPYQEVTPVVMPKSVKLETVESPPGAKGAEDDDYSASACAIIQRRNSSRRQSRRKRRSSSPFSPEIENVIRRRSSVFTTSSGDTAISIDEPAEEQIFENVKLHKEVLSGVKQQPWPLKKKLRLVRQAKAYVRKHEGALKERLAQSRSTKDVLSRASFVLHKNWQYLKREIVNFQSTLVPWERRIKQIESQFGSAVASYFIFLRWLFWINIVIALALVIFVAIPETIATLKNHSNPEDIRKKMLPSEINRTDHLSTLWEFEGYLKYSAFFYGWYSDKTAVRAYKVPLAYFVVNLIVYTYSFLVILRKMAKNSRMSKLSEKDDECAFSWKLFTGWDFMIGNSETAQNRVGSIVLGFKEALLEESEKHRDKRNWKIVALRIFVNLVVVGMFLISAYTVVTVVERSENVRARHQSWWRQNETTVVVILINYLFPMVFELLGILEKYHPRKQLRVQLARIMVLNLLTLYSLFYALFKQIHDSGEKLQSLKPKHNLTNNMHCWNESVPCNDPVIIAASALTSTAGLILSSNFLTHRAKREVPPTYQTIKDPFTQNPSESDSSSTSSSFDSELYLNDTSYYTSFEEWIWSADQRVAEEDLSVPNYSFVWDTRNYTQDTGFYNNSEVPGEESSTKAGFGVDSQILEQNVTASYNKTETTMDPYIIPQTGRPPEHFGNQVGTLVGCYIIVCNNKTRSSDDYTVLSFPVDKKTREKLRGLCWETMFGQEIAKLTVMDLIITIFQTLLMDFIRALLVRFLNNYWCWDLEKQFPQYGDFKIAENILHLVNNQGLVWMGIFFSPGLILLNIAKLIILMYLRSWTVLTCNVPHEVVFKASRSNNFYLALLLTMLFLCVLPVGYAIVWVEPSWHCGPFSGHKRIYHLATASLKQALPKYVLEYEILEYISSPGFVIPLIVLMILIIYYMVSLTNSLRESNNDLKIQLRQERTEERRRMFKIVEKRLENTDTPFARWKKILPELGFNRSSEITGTLKGNGAVTNKERKVSATSENGENTEGEQDSLPHDFPIFQLSSKPNNDSSITKKDGRKSDETAFEMLEPPNSAVIPRIRISSDDS